MDCLQSSTYRLPSSVCFVCLPAVFLSPITLLSSSLLFCSAEAERELKEAEADRSFAQTVLSREIDWRGYEAEGILNKKELSLLLDYDKQSATEQKDLLNENGAAYIALFVKILNNINKKETVEYVIFLIDSLLELSDKYQLKYVSFFHQLSQQQIDPCQPFLRSEQGTWAIQAEAT